MISISKLLNEGALDKIFHLNGVLIVDDTKRNQKDILSDIRALPAITVVRNVEMDQDPTSRYFRSEIQIKIDPYPYVKQDKFDSKTTLKVITDGIRSIPGVIGFKEQGTPYSTEN
jgi:glycosylphosphatidylinositol transamidase (GPIT) subunit GPI8